MKNKGELEVLEAQSCCLIWRIGEEGLEEVTPLLDLGE